ncbi:hypothetical protein ACFL1G_03295 [Planctomycetota bacterium]
MASLIVLLFIVACAVYLYLKSTLAKAFATVIITICASVVAFAYFEYLANIIISSGEKGQLARLVPWAHAISFVLLFILPFAVMQSLLNRLSKEKVNLGFLPERIGRIVCGIFWGMLLSGLLITVLMFAPIPSSYPYERLPKSNPDPENPNKTLLNADGFATGWFGLLSRGSFSGERSFTALHPAFLNQAYLNRYKISQHVSAAIPGSRKPIQVPKPAVWPAPKGLKLTTGQAVPPKSQATLNIVRVGMDRAIVRESGTFSLSQLRIICTNRTDIDKPLAGRAVTVYPAGYMMTEQELERTELGSIIDLALEDFEGSVKWIDFAFYVPDNTVPILLEFKQTSIFELTPPVTDEVPIIVPFVLSQAEDAEQDEDSETDESTETDESAELDESAETDEETE